MDRLEAIRQHWTKDTVRSPSFENMTDWLLDEIDRLRRIEDSLGIALRFADIGSLPSDFLQLFDTLHQNPRPRKRTDARD